MLRGSFLILQNFEFFLERNIVPILNIFPAELSPVLVWHASALVSASRKLQANSTTFGEISPFFFPSLFVHSVNPNECINGSINQGVGRPRSDATCGRIESKRYC